MRVVIFLVCISMAAIVMALPAEDLPKAEKLLGIGDSECVWHGTSPFCNGGCNVKGTYVKEISTKGDGVECVSGIKVLCCPGISIPA